MRRLAVVAAGVLLLASLAAPAARAAVTVVADNSLSNAIVTGTVLNADPTAALVSVRNNYSFWVGADLDPPVGGALLVPADPLAEPGAIFATIGLIGPNGTATWRGTFPSAAAGSQAIFVHYDVATGSGRVAVTLTILTIIADTIGEAIEIPGPAAIQTGLALVSDLPDVLNLLQAIKSGNIYDVGVSAIKLFGSRTERDSVRSALGVFGVPVTDAELAGFGSVIGIADFIQTMTDLVIAAAGGHTSGQVMFSTAGLPTPTPNPHPIAIRDLIAKLSKGALPKASVSQVKASIAAGYAAAGGGAQQVISRTTLDGMVTKCGTPIPGLGDAVPVIRFVNTAEGDRAETCFEALEQLVRLDGATLDPHFATAAIELLGYTLDQPAMVPDSISRAVVVRELDNDFAADLNSTT